MTYQTPPHRVEHLGKVLERVSTVGRVVLTTHLNADGDGAGCQAAALSWLRRRGIEAWVVNPTRYPDTFRFLVEDTSWLVSPGSATAAEVCASADLAVVFDTGEVSRIGRVKSMIEHLPKVIVDHHLPGENPIVGTSLRDETACATGELLYDLVMAAGDSLESPVAEGIYVAIMTDTGSFRFSNATVAAHQITSELIAAGAQPESIYERVYGSAPLKRYRLLAASLTELEIDQDGGVGWMTVPTDVYDAVGATAEDIDGFVDYPRSLEGVEIGILFRSSSTGDTKVSFRSKGRVDVNGLARRFGGGGHAKASGALVRGPLEKVRARVLEAAREVVRAERD